jgi:cytochrome oxidase assembly protein ShyY1
MAGVLQPPQTSVRRWASLLSVLSVLSIAAVACAALGWWQWQRAHDQAVPIDPAPSAPLADVLEPGASPGLALGRQVSATGRWTQEDVALVWGRDVDGHAAVFLLRPLRMSAQDTGTGREATIAVLVGWSGSDRAVPDVSSAPGEVVVTGYLRAGESVNPNASVPPPGLPHAFSTGSIAPSELAQIWEGPLYAAVLVSDQTDGAWQALPPPEPGSTLDFRSVAYAIEWWIFGAFCVFIGLRWVRDNGRVPEQTDAMTGSRGEEESPHE